MRNGVQLAAVVGSERRDPHGDCAREHRSRSEKLPSAHLASWPKPAGKHQQ
jgi:hypothetical protein